MSDMPVWTKERVRTPTLLQMEALECGAAALGIVLAYHERHVPLEKLREDCGVNRDGSKAANIIKAAERHGMKAEGFQLGLETLNTIPLPYILFWEFNHFVVLEGIKGGRYFINDPASGPRTVDADEFGTSYTGVAIALEPGPNFQPGGEKPSVLRGLKNRLSIGRSGLILAILAGLGLIIPGLAIPVFSKVFVDHVLVEGSRDWFKPLLLGMLLTAILRCLLEWVKSQALLRQQTKLAITSSIQFLQHVLRLPMEFFTQRYSGEIINRLGLNDSVATLLADDLAETCINIFTALFFVSIMFFYDATLTCMGVAFACVNLLLLTLFNRKYADLNQRRLQEGGKLMTTTMNGLQLIESIKATSAEGDFFRRWIGHAATYRNVSQKINRWMSLMSSVPVLVSGISSVTILGLGAFKIMEGEITVGMLVAFQSLMASFLAPFNQIVLMGTEIQAMQGDINRLDDVLKYPADSTLATPSQSSSGELRGELSVEGLSFGYSKINEPLIRDFDIHVAPGSRVALVGSSGAGKSTVSRLICGLYAPWKGNILLDGKPVAEYSRQTLLQNMAYVDQQITLFEGTVRENLTLWKRSIDESIVTQAAKDACIHDFIVSQPGSYEHMINEAGSNLSGGQRQQMEIARALALTPKILILDEAYSALDAKTEEAINRNLCERGITCLIVAHRLSTIRDCDEIIVMEQGEIVQRGKHDELIQIDGPYSRLVKA